MFLLQHAYCCWTRNQNDRARERCSCNCSWSCSRRWWNIPMQYPLPGSHPQRCAADAAAVADVFVYHGEFLSHNKPTSRCFSPPTLHRQHPQHPHAHWHRHRRCFFRLLRRVFTLLYLVNVFRNAIVYRTEQSTADRPALAEHFYFSNVNTKCQCKTK